MRKLGPGVTAAIQLAIRGTVLKADTDKPVDLGIASDPNPLPAEWPAQLQVQQPEPPAPNQPWYGRHRKRR